MKRLPSESVFQIFRYQFVKQNRLLQSFDCIDIQLALTMRVVLRNCLMEGVAPIWWHCWSNSFHRRISKNYSYGQATSPQQRFDQPTVESSTPSHRISRLDARPNEPRETGHYGHTAVVMTFSIKNKSTMHRCPLSIEMLRPDLTCLYASIKQWLHSIEYTVNLLL